jgi:hypothetical protein
MGWTSSGRPECRHPAGRSGTPNRWSRAPGVTAKTQRLQNRRSRIAPAIWADVPGGGSCTPGPGAEERGQVTREQDRISGRSPEGKDATTQP